MASVALVTSSMSPGWYTYDGMAGASAPTSRRCRRRSSSNKQKQHHHHIAHRGPEISNRFRNLQVKKDEQLENQKYYLYPK